MGDERPLFLFSFPSFPFVVKRRNLGIFINCLELVSSMKPTRKPHQPQDTHAERPKITGKKPDILSSPKTLDIQEVKSALKDGITDYLTGSHINHWSVTLAAGTTEEKLASFISEQRSCRTFEAFEKAKDAGLIKMEPAGHRPGYQGGAWASSFHM
jgi:hypothetical protein